MFGQVCPLVVEEPLPDELLEDDVDPFVVGKLVVVLVEDCAEAMNPTMKVAIVRIAKMVMRSKFRLLGRNRLSPEVDAEVMDICFRFHLLLLQIPDLR
jgi:hypothetical protein